MTELKQTLMRSRATLAQDFASAGALVVIFVAGLHLPGLF